ncbi:cell wall-associated NlpC family hydrolase [Streptomyces phaeochromogenes]|uniref:C40 family peptidase n=1 Tax=Streptomyces phaeochromogenes TaxID=1923 RepID=UPI0027909FA9|nr:C40 family peptidase [Streptomyces phaeochromogenes]MDQ0947967.1 cell wall-associated NlpC family hydrolase [Streptomyces phaeochromogenes]
MHGRSTAPIAPERTPRPGGSNLPGIPRPALATAAATSVDLYSSAGGSSPERGDDGPSREEVQQRISSLYDQAETVSGNYNATRAMSSGRSRERVTPGPDTRRGRADTVAAPALSDRAKQWFDVGRSQLGPLVPAVLPPDRMPDRDQTGTRPKSPGGRPADRSSDRALEAPGKPLLELTAGPGTATAARPVAELTAGPIAALPAVPQPREEATEVMPALVADPRQSLKTSKQRNQSKLAKARELLSAHTARRSAPVAAIEPPRTETAWATTEGQGYRQAEAEWWQSQPQSAGFGTGLSVDALGGPDLTLGMGLPAAPTPSIAPVPSIGMDLPMGPDLSSGMAPSIDVRTPIGTGLPIGSDGAANPGYGVSNPGYGAATPGYGGSTPGFGGSTPGYGGKAATAVEFARGQIGKPCVWGAMGPGSYDCSSLTQAAWKAAGVALPRTVNDQATAGMAVPLSDIRLGDLILFHGHVGHVGIYSGNGMMVHAPSPGAAIREESIHWAGEPAIHSVIRPA